MNSLENEEDDTTDCQNCFGDGEQIVFGIEEAWLEKCAYCSGKGRVKAKQESFWLPQNS